MARYRSAWTAAALAALTTAAGVRPAAHHSFSAEYLANETVTLKGTLSRLDWVNPHVWFYVDVKKPDGTVTQWAVECGAPNGMMRRGAGRDALSVGTEVVVTGYRARSGDPIVKGSRLQWPDGRVVYIGSPGTGAPDDPAVAETSPTAKK